MSSIVAFVETREFTVASAIDKYLAILAYLHKSRSTDFPKIEDYRKGNRTYFAKSQREVEDSGTGITARQIPGTVYWALATLDNRAKREILRDVLHIFGLSPVEINTVVASIPDSRRRNDPLAPYV